MDGSIFNGQLHFEEHLVVDTWTQLMTADWTVNQDTGEITNFTIASSSPSYNDQGELIHWTGRIFDL